MVRPYTNTICDHWRFKTPDEAVKSSNKIFWPLIGKYVGKKGPLAKLVTSFLTMILNIRFKLIS